MDIASKMDIVQELQHQDINRPVRYLYEQYFESAAQEIRLKGGSDDDAADIFQEAVLIVIDKVKSGLFKGESSIKTFLLAVVRKLWLYERRTRSRRLVREQKYTDLEIESNDIPDRRFSIINTDAIKRVFEQVGETCSKILTGVYYEKKSMKELLEQFNYENEQVLRNRKARCMKKLKGILNENPLLLEQLKNISFYE
jgi:RNA polymerase sigma factor (sigma-70 family)